MTCDSCGSTIWGASKRDVLDTGWKFHPIRAGTEFVMCGECEDRYALFRRARVTPPAPAAREEERSAA